MKGVKAFDSFKSDMAFGPVILPGRDRYTFTLHSKVGEIKTDASIIPWPSPHRWKKDKKEFEQEVQEILKGRQTFSLESAPKNIPLTLEELADYLTIAMSKVNVQSASLRFALEWGHTQVAIKRGMALPKNRFTVQGLHYLFKSSRRPRPERPVKIKVGRKTFTEEAMAFQSTFKNLPPCKLRLDGNLKLTLEQCLQWNDLIQKTPHTLDYFEEPFPLTPKALAIIKEAGIKVASDESTAYWASAQPHIANETPDVFIVKPAHTLGLERSIRTYLTSPTPILFSSGMDGPETMKGLQFLAAIMPTSLDGHGLDTDSLFLKN